MLAVWTDVVVLLEIEGVNDLVALGALRPEIVGKLVIAFASSERWFVENAHGFVGAG